MKVHPSTLLHPEPQNTDANGHLAPLPGGRCADAWVRFWSRRRPSPSPRAWSEFLAYYEGLYQERGPDVAHFQRLLRRHGIPAWANPFPEGDERYFHFHPHGLIVADVEAVLEDLVRAWNVQGGPGLLGDPTVATVRAEVLDASSAWPTLDQAEELRRQEQRRSQHEWAADAAVCWGMILLQGASLVPLKGWVDSENLAWATSHAIQIAPWDRWGLSPKTVIDAAHGHGLLDGDAIERLRHQVLPRA